MDKLLKFNNKLIKSGNRIVCKKDTVDPYNPLGLPANTVRVRTSDGNVPNKTNETSYETATLVSGTTDVYDVFKEGQSFANLLYNSTNVVEVLGANTTGITDMGWMFRGCSSLTTVSLFDTSSVTNMWSMFWYCSALQSVPLFNTSNVTHMNMMFQYCSSLSTVPLFDTSNVTIMLVMFAGCSSLSTVPLFDTSKVTDMNGMFNGCTSLQSIPLFNSSKVTNMNAMFAECPNVQSGALALYQQASTQTNPPTQHTYTFYNCGSNTQTGAAELAQIPSDWK